MKKTTLALLVVTVVGVLGGCASTFKAVESDPGFSYLRSTLSGTLAAPLPEVEKATVAAMKELDFVAVDVVSDRLKGTVRARMADGTKVKVRMQAVDFENTELSIRVGLFGDESISVQVLRHIRRELESTSK